MEDLQLPLVLEHAPPPPPLRVEISHNHHHPLNAVGRRGTAQLNPSTSKRASAGAHGLFEIFCGAQHFQ